MHLEDDRDEVMVVAWPDNDVTAELSTATHTNTVVIREFDVYDVVFVWTDSVDVFIGVSLHYLNFSPLGVQLLKRLDVFTEFHVSSSSPVLALELVQRDGSAVVDVDPPGPTAEHTLGRGSVGGPPWPIL